MALQTILVQASEIHKNNEKGTVLTFYYKTGEQESILNQDRKTQENHTIRTM